MTWNIGILDTKWHSEHSVVVLDIWWLSPSILPLSRCWQISYMRIHLNVAPGNAYKARTLLCCYCAVLIRSPQRLLIGPMISELLFRTCSDIWGAMVLDCEYLWKAMVFDCVSILVGSDDSTSKEQEKTFWPFTLARCQARWHHTLHCNRSWPSSKICKYILFHRWMVRNMLERVISG